MRTIFSLLATALCAYSFLKLTDTVHANTVDYFAGFGSFETSNPDDVLNFGGTNLSNSIPGWVVYRSGSSFTPFPQWQRNGQSQDGDRHLLLRSRGGSDPGSNTALFDFAISPAALTPGELYELTFWAAGGVNSSSLGFNQLRVLVSQATRTDISDPFDPFIIPEAAQEEVLEWQQYSLIFMPVSQEVSFSASAPLGSSSSVFLDNFSLRHIPEPGSAVLVGAAVAFLGLRRRRSAPASAGLGTP